MDYPGFIGGHFVAQSSLAASRQVINFYPEQTNTQSRSVGAFYPTPGMLSLIQFPYGDAIGRAAFSMSGRVWFIMGGGVYEIFANPKAVKMGTVPYANNQLAQITTNQLVNCIASGGILTYLDLTSGAMTAVSGVTFTNVNKVGMIDGFFVALDEGQNRIYVSPLFDSAGVWDPTQFIRRTTQPDPWRALCVIPPNIWAIGELTGDILFDAGTSPFPLAPRPGITYRYGTKAPNSVASFGDSVFWLANDKDGNGVVVQTVGYTPTPISDKALEYEIAQWERAGLTSDAEAFTYKENGSAFYVLTFPSVPTTRAYNISARLWDKRGRWNQGTGSYDAWAPRVHTVGFGKHLVASSSPTFSSGFISELSTDIPVESDGHFIRRVLVPPPIWSSSGGKRMFIRRLQLLVESGASTLQGTPRVMLRTSHDTKTWSNERLCSIGGQGEFQKLAFWLQNGASTMLFQPEFVFSDAYPWRVIGAEIDVTGQRSDGPAQ